MRYALGFSARKLVYLREFVGGWVWPLPGAWALRPGDELYVWGSHPVDFRLPDGVGLWWVEDGFLRSVGLGSELVAPVSWVFDRKAPHYDPDRVSELEAMLEFADFSPAIIERAANLIDTIVAHKLTKYNVGTVGQWRRTSDKPVLLVVGQVEGDAALVAGARGAVRGNLDLLQAVRREMPHAHIVYKPHPDVVAGLRAGGDFDAGQWADEVVTQASITDLIEQVDAVHVMTSLAGFEALLRGRRVVCHGQPFYSGWGLTEDRMPHARRKRRRVLAELVAAALIIYPRYLNPVTRKPCSVEQAIEGMLAYTRRDKSWGEEMRRGLMRTIARLAA